MPSTDDLTLYQWGKESTPGTAVAATSQIAVPRIDIAPIDSILRPRYAKGLVVRNRGNEAVMERGSVLTVPPFPVNYEQNQNWMTLAVSGASAAVTPTGASPYVYTATRAPATDPALKSWTIERRLGDFSGNRDEEWAYCLARSITYSFEMGGALMFGAELFARRRQSSTLTAAQTMPAAEVAAASLIKTFMDTSWANLGNTQVTGQAIKGAITFNTGCEPMQTADGRTDQDFSIVVLNGENVNVAGSLTILCATQYDAEKTAAEALSLRAMRWQADGSGGRQIQIDALLKHELASVPMVETQSGQWIVNLVFQEATDGTNLFRVKTTNLVSAMV